MAKKKAEAPNVPAGYAKPVTPDSVLKKAIQHMVNRGKTYDRSGNYKKPKERSMAATVAAFNAVTGKNLTEADGWTFMVLLKLVRGQAAKVYHADSYEDGSAYLGLLAEAMSTERPVPTLSTRQQAPAGHSRQGAMTATRGPNDGPIAGASDGVSGD